MERHRAHPQVGDCVYRRTPARRWRQILLDFGKRWLRNAGRPWHGRCFATPRSSSSHLGPIGSIELEQQLRRLLAFLFKQISAALPERFQYFGIWTLLCFLLQAFLRGSS